MKPDAKGYELSNGLTQRWTEHKSNRTSNYSDIVLRGYKDGKDKWVTKSNVKDG